MLHYDGQYSGAALNSFMMGLGQSPATIQRILATQGLKTIDPDAWYDLDTARALYYEVEKTVGSSALFTVGRQMIATAPFPPEIDDISAVLMSLDAAYKMNVRGAKIGGIQTLLDDEDTALITFSTPFPCHLEQGVIAGCCYKFDSVPLLEHVSKECRDSGAEACVYRISW